MVDEICNGGELFFYVKNCGAFPEPLARFYFRQIIQGIEAIHLQGLAHRDIKPDNVLIDENFNVKISDFGYAGVLAGRTGNGYMKTILGTRPYQAPEINEGKPYKGELVDVFATAVVMFILVLGSFPFSLGDKQEYYYKMIYNREWSKYWDALLTKKGNTSKISEEFKDLMEKLLDYNYNKRLTIKEIKEHPWYTADVPSYEEVFLEMKRRKDVTDDLKRKEDEAKSR